MHTACIVCSFENSHSLSLWSGATCCQPHANPSLHHHQQLCSREYGLEKPAAQMFCQRGSLRKCQTTGWLSRCTFRSNIDVVCSMAAREGISSHAINRLTSCVTEDRAWLFFFFLSLPTMKFPTLYWPHIVNYRLMNQRKTHTLQQRLKGKNWRGARPKLALKTKRREASNWCVLGYCSIVILTIFVIHLWFCIHDWLIDHSCEWVCYLSTSLPVEVTHWRRRSWNRSVYYKRRRSY